MTLTRLASFTLAAALAAPLALAQTGGLRAQCDVNGEAVSLDLGYEAIGGTGVTWGTGPNPDITGVISDGSTTVYWQGTMSSARGNLPISGENHFLRFYDANVLNRETVLEVTMTGQDSFTLTDVFGNYPGNHPCRITQLW